jgi:hypothetical protein
MWDFEVYFINHFSFFSIFEPKISSIHPIRKLLGPHMPYNIALNTIGRAEGGVPGAASGRVTSIGEKSAKIRNVYSSMFDTKLIVNHLSFANIFS